MKLNVYGRIVQIEQATDSWKAYYVGNEGKRRPAVDIVIPKHINRENLLEYIADLCHEWATPRNNDVKILE